MALASARRRRYASFKNNPLCRRPEDAGKVNVGPGLRQGLQLKYAAKVHPAGLLLERVSDVRAHLLARLPLSGPSSRRLPCFVAPDDASHIRLKVFLDVLGQIGLPTTLAYRLCY